MRNLTLKAFYVTVLGAGLASWSTSAAIYQEAGGQVVIEAEHFHERTRHLHAAGDDHHWHVVPSEDGNDFLNDAGDPPFTSAGGNAYVVPEFQKGIVLWQPLFLQYSPFFSRFPI